jgi:NADH-quinone oxidoreductase subunit M
MVGLISALIIVPLTGAFALYVGRPRNARAIALIFNALAAFLALTLWRNFDSGAAGLQMVERHAWIPAIGAEYLVGVDGLSLLLVLLTSFIIPFAFLAQRMTRGFCSIMLVMQSALYGTFTAQNFLLWFLFYEMSLIPAFLLIKIWGGENRDRAATKFFLYTFLGSVAMLLSFLGIYFAKGTFDFATLAVLGKDGLLTGKLAWLAFGGIFIGLAVKVPIFPFHTWLPDAYDGIDRRSLENGRLRFRAPAASAFPQRNQNSRPLDAWTRGLLHRLRVTRRMGPIGFETDGGLPVYQPSRLLHAWSLRCYCLARHCS